MTTLTTLEVLRAARERLTNPKMWRHEGTVGANGERCLGLTLSDVGDRDYEAHLAVARALGLVTEETTPRNETIYDWNDDAATTHADVLAALDKTIAIEEAKVAA
jgi:hypothetical protein